MPDLYKARTISPLLSAVGSTSAGRKRPTNEDNYLCLSEQGIWLVADGVGGNVGGQHASKFVCDHLPPLLLSGLVANHAIADVHKSLKQTAEQDLTKCGMATTLVLAVQKDDRIDIFWAGDSRAYLYSKAELNRVTKDHTLMQRLEDMGIEPKHTQVIKLANSIVTRCVGSAHIDVLKADVASVSFANEKKLLLCSDGLTDELSDQDIHRLIASAPDSADAVDNLIQAANQNGGKDNITVVLIDMPNI